MVRYRSGEFSVICGPFEGAANRRPEKSAPGDNVGVGDDVHENVSTTVNAAVAPSDANFSRGGIGGERTGRQQKVRGIEADRLVSKDVDEVVVVTEEADLVVPG